MSKSMQQFSLRDNFISCCRSFHHDRPRPHAIRRTGAFSAPREAMDDVALPGDGRDRGPAPASRLPQDGLVSMLFQTNGPSSSSASGPSGCLFRLLRTPTIVAVSQDRGGLGDIRDTEIPHLEGRPAEGQRLLANSGLTMDSVYGTRAPDLAGSNQEDSFDLWSLRESDANSPNKSRTTSSQGQESEPGNTPEPEVHKFPPDPPALGSERCSSPTKGPWWRELLASPVKKLRLSDIGRNIKALAMPALDLPPQPMQQNPQPSDPTVTEKDRRKDLPKRRLTHNIAKPSIKAAVKLAKAKNALAGIVARVEEDFCANSSRAAKNAKRNTVNQVLRAGGEGFPLTPFALKMLAGTLREAGYKSTSQYLVEAKLAHVESGHPWTSLLDRHFKLCMAAAKRGQGPRKKAAEVPETEWTAHSLLADPLTTGMKVNLPTHLFACGVHWMMREIEIAALTAEDIKFEEASRMVTINWKESKKDAEGLGISRTLQCVCEHGCDLRCPFAVLESLVNLAALRGTPGGHIASNRKGKPASKSDIVKDWRKLYGDGITGHSTRRTGALQYIRNGWPVAQVGFLGRWKSNVILEYAQEALESLAVNNSGCFGTNTQQMQLAQQLIKGNSAETALPKDASIQSVKANTKVISNLQKELDSFKDDTKGSHSNLEKAIKELENRMGTAAKYLPNLVKSVKQQVVHLNTRTLLYSPPIGWRTRCGWYFHASNYEFAEGDNTMVSCSKCQLSALGQGGGSS